MNKRLDDPVTQAINRWYDFAMFTPRALVCDFVNYGYWEPGITTRQEACENLLEKLLSFIARKDGRILDVACGKGATTRHLLKYYPAQNVTGINISDKQLEKCRVNAPNCNFILMNATQMRFEDVSFDNVICVEAALHFNTRETFLKEVVRILKPGGYLVLSDVLATRQRERSSPMRSVENYLPNPEAYRRLCMRVGFENVRVVDATRECWLSHYRRATKNARRQFNRDEISADTLRRRVARLNRRANYINYYVLVAARKPRQDRLRES